jgi:hypothetical protein
VATAAGGETARDAGDAGDEDEEDPEGGAGAWSDSESESEAESGDEFARTLAASAEAKRTDGASMATLFRALFGATGPTTPHARLLVAVVASSSSSSSSNNNGSSAATTPLDWHAPPSPAAWVAAPFLLGLLAPLRSKVVRDVVQQLDKKEDLVVRCFESLEAAARHFKVSGALLRIRGTSRYRGAL